MTQPTDIVQRARRALRSLRSSSRDQDVEHAWLRVGVCTVALTYVWYLTKSEGLTTGLMLGLAASIGDALVGAGMIWWLRKSKAHMLLLRYVGIIADNVALTVGMAAAGEGGVALLGVYLWLTIGNGFRFGPRYLLASYWLTLAGFGLQVLVVPYWQQHRALGVGLWLVALILPLYVLMLLLRLTDQKEAAEQLCKAKEQELAALRLSL